MESKVLGAKENGAQATASCHRATGTQMGMAIGKLVLGQLVLSRQHLVLGRRKRRVLGVVCVQLQVDGARAMATAAWARMVLGRQQRLVLGRRPRRVLGVDCAWAGMVLEPRQLVLRRQRLDLERRRRRQLLVGRGWFSGLVLGRQHLVLGLS